MGSNRQRLSDFREKNDKFYERYGTSFLGRFDDALEIINLASLTSPMSRGDVAFDLQANSALNVTQNDEHTFNDLQ